jgi:hypothetical protein
MKQRLTSYWHSAAGVNLRLRLYYLLALLLLLVAQHGAAQVEAFRIRLVLLPLGTVSVSVDDGNRFTTIGRVLALPNRTLPSQAPRATATRKGKNLWLLQFHEKEAVELAAAGVVMPAALSTDIPADSVLFGDYGTNFSVRLLLQEGRVAYSLPPGYRYKPGDVWVLQILTDDESQAQSLRQMVVTVLAKESRLATQRSLLRAQKANLPVVNGTLNLKVTARYAERVKYVFFSVDGYPAGTSNMLPTIFRWDSRQVVDGEYVVEARAVDDSGREIAVVRKRLLVKNGSQ